MRRFELEQAEQRVAEGVLFESGHVCTVNRPVAVHGEPTVPSWPTIFPMIEDVGRAHPNAQLNWIDPE